MEHYSFIDKVAKQHILKKLAPAVALSTGLSACGPSPSATEPYSVPTMKRIVRPRQVTIFNNAIDAIKPQIAEVVKRPRPKYRGPGDVFMTRLRRAVELQDIMQPYYDQYDSLSPEDKNIAFDKFTELEKYFQTERDKFLKEMDEDWFAFKPWQRARFNERQI